MIRHYNPINPQLLNRPPRIPNVLSLLQHKRLAPRNPLPRLLNPRHLLPRMRAPVPDIVDPFSSRFVRHGLRINAIGRETLLKHRVREPGLRLDRGRKRRWSLPRRRAASRAAAC